MALHYSENRYDLMYGPIKIGEFIERYDPRRKVEIELNEVVLEHPHDRRFIFFDQYAIEGKLDDKHTRAWISRRVFPKTRHNRDELLREMGLSEYDQIDIFKKNSGGCANDYIWVAFSEKWTFEKLRPYYLNLFSDYNWDHENNTFRYQRTEERFNPSVVYGLTQRSAKDKEPLVLE